MNVNVNLAFLSLSILYIAFLNVIFLKKGHIKTFELDTFGKLITLNLIGILLEFGCIFTIKYSSSEILIEIVNRLFLLYLVTFVFLFSLYVFSISFDKANKKNNTLRMIIMLMYLFSVFLIFYLKLDIYNKNNIIYSYGPSTNVVYIISTICVILCFVSMIKNYKELKSKKYLPLFVFIIGGSVVALIQKINPALTLATSMEAYLLMIMYHTIENPDMKILEEVHRAKEISDNANEEKTMFLYNMTNEIRGITRDINKEADIILDETDNKKIDVEVIDNSAREIKGSTARFTTMTNEILDVSNMDGASIRVYDEKYNIRLILDSLISIYKKKCNSKNISFRSNISSDIPKYLYGEDFIKGYAIVKNGSDLPLIINKGGKEVIKAGEYFSLYRANSDIIASKVTKDGLKYGILNSNLKEKTPFKYDIISYKNGVYSYVLDNDVGLINEDGKKIYTYKLTDRDDKGIDVTPSSVTSDNYQRYGVVKVNKTSLIVNLKDDEVKYKQKIISIVVICIFILNASFIVINSTEHIAANKVDENDGMQIRYLIEEYEKNTGIKVTKFGYKYDLNPQQFAVGIQPMQSLTERKLA